MRRRPVVVVLHGPSGVGKDTVVEGLKERMGIHRPTSTTSRPARPGEQDGVHYHFVSAEEFERKVAEGEFAEYARVYDDWKGLEWRELLAPLDEGKDVIIRTDVQGARRFREELEGAVFVFLNAEDRDVLRARLIGRETEDAESLARRMAELEEELADLDNNDYVVVNPHGGLDQAVTEIAEIIERERVNPKRPDVRVRAGLRVPPGTAGT